MKDELREVFREAIIARFGSINDMGCYTDFRNENGEMAWMSTQAFMNIIDDVIDEIDIEDFIDNED